MKRGIWKTGIKTLCLCIVFICQLTVVSFANTTPTNIKVEYKYSPINDLTEKEKNLIQYQTITETASKNENYYLIYSPINATATKTPISWNYIMILIAVVIVLLVVVYKRKKKASSVIAVFLATTLLVEGVVVRAELSDTNSLSKYNQEFDLKIGDQLPKPQTIEGYQYLGYITGEKLATLSPQKSVAETSEKTLSPAIETTNNSVNSSVVNANVGGVIKQQDKVFTRIIEQEEIIDYNNLSVVYKEDVSLAYGETRKEEGKNGSIITELEVTSINGVIVSSKVVGKRIIDAVPTVVYISSQENPNQPDTPHQPEEPKTPITVRKEVIERTSIPFEIDYRNDENLFYGLEVEEETGREGILVTTYEEIYQDSILLSKTKISENVEVNAINKVIRQGSKLNSAPVLTITKVIKDNLANTASLTYHLEDSDGGYQSAQVVVYRKEVPTQAIATYNLPAFDENKNSVINIEGLVNNQEYIVKVNLVYNNRKEEVAVNDLLEKEITLAKKVEIKNIESIELFDAQNNKLDINTISSIPSDITSHSLKFNISNHKNIILPIINMVDEVKNGREVYKITVQTPQLVHDIGVDFKENAVVYIPKLNRTSDAYYSFRELVEAMQNNPTGTFVLGANLDASSYPIPDVNNFAYVTQEFKGTLIGERNGVKYAIEGLKAPLFKTTKNATIQNLDLKNVDINTSAVDIAPLVSDATGKTLIENVAVSGNVKTSRYMAGIVNKLKDTSILRNVLFKGNLISTADDDNAIGGAVGRTTGNAIVEQANIQVNITVKSTKQIGHIGGIIGNLRDNSKLYRSYVEGKIDNSGNTTGSVGGAIGLVTQAGALANDVVVAVEVINGYKTYGGSGYTTNKLTNIYYDDVISTGEEDRQTPTSQAMSPEQSKEKVASYQLTATLEDSNFDYNITETVYSSAVGYNASKEMIYRNMEMLVPFYDKQTIVDLGNLVTSDSNLATKEILSVTAMQDNTIFYNLSENKEKLNKIIVVYKDQSTDTFSVTHKGTFADTRIEEYTIDGTRLLYTPEMFKQSQINVDSLVRQLTALNYKDTLFQLYPDFEYSHAQKVGYTYALNLQFNVKENHEIAARTLKENKVDPYSLEKSFEAVKADLKKYIVALLESSEVDATNKFNPSERLAYIEANKEKILFGLAYINRWYNFKVGGVDAREITVYKQDIFGKKIDMIQNIIDIADVANPISDSSKKYLLFGEHSATAYAKVFGSKNGKNNIVNYLESLGSIFNKDQTMADWFVETTKAEVVEQPMEYNGTQLGVYRLWDNLKKNDNAKLMLPILSLPSMGLGIISHPSAVAFFPFENYYDLPTSESYADKPDVVKSIRNRMDIAAQVMRLNFEFWYRISDASVRDKLWNDGKVPMLTWDGYRHISGKWTVPFSADEAPNTSVNKSAGPAVAEFFTPVGKWYANNGLGAYADGKIIHFVFNTLLTKLGGGIFTHEAVHNLDGVVYLGGYGRRMGAEDYATGMWHSVDVADETFGMNTDIDYNTYGNGASMPKRLHNATPERFANAQELEEYWRRSMDVLYTLYYAEAEELLKLSAEDQAYMLAKTEFRLLEAGKKEETVKTLTTAEVEAMNLMTINDLIENQLVVHNFGKKTSRDHVYKVPQNSYETFNRFNSFYGTFTSPGVLTGSRAFKGMTFEMLAAAGYEGFVNYASSKLASTATNEGTTLSDAYILNKTFGGKYNTMNDFRKDMFAQRYAKKDMIKPFVYKGQTYTTYEDIKTLLANAIQKDLEKAKRFEFTYTNIRELKREIFKYYIQSTNDFTESIYK